MKKIDSKNFFKPDFISKVTIKIRPELKVVSLEGQGDPMKTFDKKLAKIFFWLDKNNIVSSNKPTLGIYYKNRNEVGVNNIKWDACIQVDKNIKTDGKIKYQIISETLVASVILTGGYELIGPALKYMEQVTRENRVKTKWPLTEIYIREGKSPITELQYLASK